MAPHGFDDPSEIVWPDLDSSFVDEFGEIDRDVYDIARKVWPAVVPSIRRTVGDVQRCQPIMMKASALVSRKLREEPDRITNLHGYLYKTFIRLLCEEVEKETRHALLARAGGSQNMAWSERPEEEIHKLILIHEVLARSDPRTREVYQLLMLGHTFEEIAVKYGMQSNHLRSQWSKGFHRMVKRIESETRAAEQRVLRRQDRSD